MAETIPYSSTNTSSETYEGAQLECIKKLIEIVENGTEKM